MLWILKLLFNHVFMQISDKFQFHFDELHPFAISGVDSYN